VTVDKFFVMTDLKSNLA